MVQRHLGLFHELVELELQVAMDVEEKEADHMDWYEPKMTDLERFLEMVGAWMDKEEKEDGSDDVAAAGHSNDADKESVPVGPSMCTAAAAVTNVPPECCSH